jgi:hypothetical protein
MACIRRWPASQTKERTMSKPNIGNELRNAAVEPLLPIEKKLIGWSLGVGVTLLVVLAVVNHLFPVSL